jgi:hypothetical protein
VISSKLVSGYLVDRPRVQNRRSRYYVGCTVYNCAHKCRLLPGQNSAAMKSSRRYTGPYVSEEIDPLYRIVLDEEKLSLVRLKHEADTLRPAVRDVFTGEIGTVRFVRDANGHVSGFVLNTGRIQNFHFAKKTS